MPRSPGEHDLAILLARLEPILDPEAYVFCTTSEALPGVDFFAAIDEPEGLTLILREDEAEELGLPTEFVAGRITLNVQSALDSVGLTAAVATRLAEAGISCNVIAGFFHDHLFVPFASAEEAMGVLAEFGASSRK